MMKQETRKQLDKFYTSPEAAQSFLMDVNGIINLSHYDNVIEPSAGNGSLLNYLPTDTIALDLLPEREDIIQQDFFDYNFPTGKNILISNPPFGNRSRMAIDFFNKAAESCEVICMIIPVTWEKYSIQKQLNEDWHLVFNDRLPEKSFLLAGKPYRVRCTKQVWVRSDLNDDSYGGFNLA